MKRKPWRKKLFWERIRSIDIFGFADQDETTYGLGYEDILRHDNGVAAAKVVIKDISWFVEIFATNPAIQPLIAIQMLWEFPAELNYEERTVFSKKKLNDGTRVFHLGIQSGKNIPSCAILAFMEIRKFDEQIRDFSAFDWLPVSSAVCILGSDSYLDSRTGFDYPSFYFQERFYEKKLFS